MRRLFFIGFALIASFVYAENQERFMSRMAKFISSISGVDGCIVDNPSDLLYLTGISASRGRVFASAQGGKLFLDGRYIENAKKKAPCPVFLHEEKTFREQLATFKKIGFDSSFTTYDDYLSLKNTYPEIEWVPISKPLKQIRVCKDSSEVAALQKAADLTWRGYQKILEVLKEGITEEEVAREFEFFCRENGASGLSFESIIAFGENSAYPHHRAGKTQLKKNQIVLADIGAVVDSYHADMTRVSFFGESDPELLKIKELVIRAQKKAAAHVRPGVAVKDLDRIVREEFRKEGLEEYFTHSLGHGIGLETHEYPRVKEDSPDKDLILKPGMVFTIEPGLYLPGLGGVRYEDMFLVTETGSRNFFP